MKEGGIVNLRERDEQGTIKIGIVDLYSNGKEDAIKNFEMRGHRNKSWENHPDNIIKVLRSKFVPNAEIYLVPNTDKGIQHLIDVGCVLVNISLAGYGASTIYDKLAKKAFVVAGAGNGGEKGESWLSLQDYSCAVGAVNRFLKPTYYSAYGKNAIKTVSIEPILDGVTLHGTSFTAPVIVGLLAQWYIWYEDIFNCYPSILQTNEFIERYSQDIFDDGPDMKTGYGLLRLPVKFEAEDIVVMTGNRLATKIKHVEGESPVNSQIDLLIEPFIKNSRTMVGSNGLTSALGITVHWDGEVSHYIR